MKKIDIKTSKLPKTWLIDLDGTIIQHNSHLVEKNILLKGVKKFWKKISKVDKIVILSARPEKYKKSTISFLKRNSLRFDHIIFNLNVGERLLINDKKPDGLKTSISINVKRNDGLENIIIKNKKN